MAGTHETKVVSNDLIRNFKKAKGKEFKDSALKRKADQSLSSEGPPTKKKFIPGKKSGKFGPKKPFQKGQPFDGKPDWREVRQDTKERKKKRKQRNVGGEQQFDKFSKAIKLWEDLRRSTCEKEKKLELCHEVAKYFKGNVEIWMKQAAGVRMLEHLIVHGDAEIRSQLFKEVNNKKALLEIMKDTHSYRFLLKMLKHGKKDERAAIISAMDGQIVRLTKHSIASQVVESAFSEFGTSMQRGTMLQEFFGPRFKYFKEDGIKSLTDVLERHPDKKESILKQLQSGLQPVMHKGIFNNALILSLLREYMMFSDQLEKSAVIESVEEGLVGIVHTKDGARLAMQCLWYGTAKQRKTILKSFKEHIFEVATWDHSFMVLLAALDCVDDTKFLGKAVIEPLMKQKEQLIESEIGMRVMRYLIFGRNPTFFHPDVLSVLKLGDSNPHSKKDASLRRQEIVAIIGDSFHDLIINNLEKWWTDKQWTLFLGPAINSLPKAQQQKPVMENLAKLCSIQEGESFIDVPHANKMINFLIGKDKENKEKKMPIFSLFLLEEAEQNITKWLDCNRGCFLAVRLIETGIGRVIVKTRDLVKKNIKTVKKQKVAGAEILLKKLKEAENVEESDEEEETSDVEGSGENEENGDGVNDDDAMNGEENDDGEMDDEEENDEDHESSDDHEIVNGDNEEGEDEESDADEEGENEESDADEEMEGESDGDED